MQKINPSTDKTLKDYQRIKRWTISKKIALVWNILSLVLAFLSLGVFSIFYIIFVGDLDLKLSATLKSWQGKLIFLTLIIVPILIHELIHGAVMAIHGGKPKYGVDFALRIMPYAYATSNKAFTRTQFVQISLAPLIVISLIGTILMVVFQYPLFLIPLTINAGGAIGDLWFCLIALRQPDEALFLDEKIGFSIYTPIDISGRKQ